MFFFLFLVTCRVRVLEDLTRVHNCDMVESGHSQRNFRNATPICILVEKKQPESWVNQESRGKEKQAQAAKQQAESTQEADAMRKKEAEAQVAKSQSRPN